MTDNKELHPDRLQATDLNPFLRTSPDRRTEMMFPNVDGLDPKSPNLTDEEKLRILQRIRVDPKYFIENIVRGDPLKAEQLMNALRVVDHADRLKDLTNGPVIFVPRTVSPRYSHPGILRQAIQRNLAARELVSEHLRKFMEPALKAYKVRDKIRARRRIKRRGRKH